MITWITQNAGTIIVGLVLLAFLGLVAFSLIHKMKKGETSCGCGCSKCAMQGECHKKE